MAKYDVECPVCGTSYRVDLVGPHRDREWRLENWDWTCDECKEMARQEENAKAAAANAAAGLPALTGSEKMVAWAEMIRKQKLATLEEEMSRRDLNTAPDKDRLLAAVANLKGRTSSRWWIDNRDAHIMGLLRDEYQVTEKPLPSEEKKIAEEAKAKAQIEATVRPEKPVTETVAEIRALESAVEVAFPEKREDFRQIVRFSLGYSWTGALWRRDLKPTNGTAQDRAAEAGNRLLAAGFPIRIFDDSLRVRAVYGTYEPESRRWVMARTSGQYNGWFAISWPKGEDFYQAAKRIHGARYDKPAIVVPPEQFQEILDFAEMYEFSLSPGALKLVETCRAVREKALTTKPQVPETHRLPKPGEKPEHLDVPQDVDVADEFREEVQP